MGETDSNQAPQVVPPEVKKVTDTISKYQIGLHLSDLTEDAKAGVAEALKRAEQRITFSTVIGHWKEILIFFLAVAFFFMYQSMDTAKRELATKNETYNRLEKIDKIDSTLQAVEEHQKELYPAIDENIAGIERTREQIRILTQKVETLNQDKYRKAAENLDAEGVVKDFGLLGYPAKVVTIGGTAK